MARYIPRQNMQIPVAQNRNKIAVSKMRFRNNTGGYAFLVREPEKRFRVSLLVRSLRDGNIFK